MPEQCTYPRIGVGAIVIRDGKILLVKRAHEPSKGLWAIPGGRLELGETLQQATEREIREETGIVIRARDPYHIFDLIDRDKSGQLRFHYVIVDLMADYLSGEPMPNEEVQEARWIKPEDLDSLRVSDHTRHLLVDRLRFAPGASASENAATQRHRS